MTIAGIVSNGGKTGAVNVGNIKSISKFVSTRSEQFRALHLLDRACYLLDMRVYPSTHPAPWEIWFCNA